MIIFPPNSMLKGGTRPRNFLKGQTFKATWVWTTGGPQTQPNQTGDGINFASKISGHVLVFQPVVLLCWSTICNVDPWLGFLYTVPPHPLISMLWRALFIHLRNLFRERADAAQNIKEQNNIEIGGRGEHEERLHRDKHCTTQKKSKLLCPFTCEINSVTSSILDGCFPHKYASESTRRYLVVRGVRGRALKGCNIVSF